MEPSVLTNREVAALVILAGFIGFVLIGPGRREVRSSLRDVLASAAKPWLLIPLLLYIAWIAGAVVVAARVGLWDSDLLKATILWVLLSGMALVLRLNDAIQKPGFFRQAVLRTVGVAALVEFLASLKSFPLWLEIPGQVLAVLFALVAVVAERDPKSAPVRKLANGYLVIFGISALIWSVAHLMADWSVLDQEKIRGDFLLPVWLTPVALLFVYGFAVVVAFQSCFLRMRIWKREGPLLRQRLAVVLRANIRLGSLRPLSGIGAQRIARTDGFRAAWKEIAAIRRDKLEESAQEEAARRRLVENAGHVGTDDEGRQLDQREFEETKEALEWLASCHVGHYRNGRQRYRSDLIPIVESGFSGLPEGHGIEDHVSGDGQRWYATRQTITGWWFGIGASGPPPDQWFYDGPEAPRGFPSEPDWDHFGTGTVAPNWD